MRLMHKLLEALMTMILIRECNYSEFRLRGKDSLPTTGTTPSWNFHCQLKYTLIYDNIWSHSLMGNLNCCWVFLSLNGQMYIYRFCPKQCHTNEGEAYYLGLWPLGLLSEVVSLCFGGNIPVRRRLIYMESEFKLNSGTKCEHFVSTANRGQNQSVERHCLGENKQLEMKI